MMANGKGGINERGMLLLEGDISLCRKLCRVTVKNGQSLPKSEKGITAAGSLFD